MAGKMAKNMLFIVFINYSVFKGFLKSINQVCFDDFAVKRTIESRTQDYKNRENCLAFAQQQGRGKA